MTTAPPLCPTCGQPATLDFADTDDRWECRNEACPEFGQVISPSDEPQDPPAPA
jgi:hypothetical protein